MKMIRFLDLMNKLEHDHILTLPVKEQIRYVKKMEVYKKRAEKYLEKTLNDRTTNIMRLRWIKATFTQTLETLRRFLSRFA